MFFPLVKKRVIYDLGIGKDTLVIVVIYLVSLNALDIFLFA